MELTIEQALQQGIAAHKEGKLQDAERLYRAILQSQPLHPDANHNLGVLAVSVNKTAAALPLFKVALEANPKIEQFWLSDIEALIKEKQFDNAKAVLEQAKQQGVAEEKLNTLEAQLPFETQIENVNSANPPQERLSSLLECYQTGQYGDAEKLAVSITQEFPKHQFGWKVLSAVLKQTGRVSESLVASQKSVQLVPQDAEAHSNLGITLHELGRLEEAEASFRQAIALKPDFAGAHNNLGIMLKELGRLDEAEAIYRQAIALKPNYAEAHNNLGATLKELGRLEEAEASYRQVITLNPDFAGAHSNLGITLHELGRLDEAAASYAKAIALKPDFAGAHSNLGITLQELRRLDEAEASYKQAIALKPDYAEAHYNLGITLQELGRLDEAAASYAKAIALKPDYAEAHYNLGITLQELGRLDEAAASYAKAIALDKKEPRYEGAYANLITYLNEACSAHFKLEKIWEESSMETRSGIMLPLAINRFLMGDLKGCRQIFLSHFSTLSEPQKLKLNNGNNYWGWLRFLLEWHDENPQNENPQLPLKTLYVIGDSHSLAYHGITLKIGNDTFLCKSEWIWGCKQFHIGNRKVNKFRYKLDKLFSSLPPASSVLLSIGEIDCRLDDGIIPHCKKNPEKKIQRVISTTVENYLDYILEKSSAYLHKVTIQGIPCPNLDRATFENQEIEELIELIQKFNVELKAKSISYGLEFLDLRTITNDSNGFSNGLWHADAYHITPDGAVEALRHHKFK
jgi:tetratricopeptide (TPR) repeat protein